MVVMALVASHHHRDLSVVEHLSVGAPSVSSAMVAREPAISGVVVLPTCNRFEVYVETSDPDRARQAVLDTLAQSTSMTAAAIDRALATYDGDDAVQHLMSVAAGLESMVVGEREISGQVRRALLEAQAQGCVSPALDRMFQAALRTARKVAAQTGLGTSGRSVVSVALDIAGQHVSWPHARAVIVGTGALAHAGVGWLRSHGTDVVGVYSPRGRGERFGADHQLPSLDFDQLSQALAHVDVVYACSGGESIVLTAAVVAGARQRATGELTIIDLALHRDVAPGVEDLTGVRVIGLTDVAQHAPDESVEAIQAAQDIIAHAVARFGSGESARELDPAVVALREHVWALLEKELAKVRPAPGADQDTMMRAEATEVALRRFAKTLLHTPTVRARELAQSGSAHEYVEAMRALYGIEVAVSGDDAVPPENSKG